MQKGKDGNEELQSIERCPADKNELLIYCRHLSTIYVIYVTIFGT